MLPIRWVGLSLFSNICRSPNLWARWSRRLNARGRYRKSLQCHRWGTRSTHSPKEVPLVGRHWCLSWMWFDAASEVAHCSLVAPLSTLGLIPRTCDYKCTEEVSLYSLASQLCFCSCEVAMLFWDLSRKNLQRQFRFVSVQNARPLRGCAFERCEKCLPHQPVVFLSALVLTLLRESPVSSGRDNGLWDV